jgi:hypothetical protein
MKKNERQTFSEPEKNKKDIKDEKFMEGNLLGFAIATILWSVLFGYILGQLK